jgi:hypothetical protein
MRAQQAEETIDRERWCRTVIERTESGAIESRETAGRANPKIALTILPESLNYVFRKTVLRMPDGTCEMCRLGQDR